VASARPELDVPVLLLATPIALETSQTKTKNQDHPMRAVSAESIWCATDSCSYVQFCKAVAWTRACTVLQTVLPAEPNPQLRSNGAMCSFGQHQAQRTQIRISQDLSTSTDTKCKSRSCCTHYVWITQSTRPPCAHSSGMLAFASMAVAAPTPLPPIIRRVRCARCCSGCSNARTPSSPILL
jgi:hypothetical protein